MKAGSASTDRMIGTVHTLPTKLELGNCAAEMAVLHTIANYQNNCCQAAHFLSLSYL